MKKGILSILSILIVGVAVAQDIKLAHPGTKEFTIGPDGPDDCPLYFTNNTASPMVVSYRKVFADAPTGWIITLCDNVNCYGELITGDTFATIQPNEKVSLKISFLAMKKTDTAIIQYEIWNKYGTSQVKDTLSWRVYMPISNTTDVKYVVETVGPNPVMDVLNLPINASCVAVYDLQGKLVLAENQIENGKLNFVDLSTGAYVVTYKVNNIQYKNQILKK